MSKYFCSISPEKDTVVLDLKKLFPDLMSNVSIKVGNISSGNDEYVNNNIYINSVKCSVLSNDGVSDTKITNKVQPFLTTVRVDCTNGITPCSFDLIINNDATNKSITVYVSDGDVQIIQDCEFDALQLDTKLQTFMLLRSNPKLTGNIKLVVGSDYNLYLDTFKVSNKLNERVFRKYPISSDGNYPRDVMTVFSKLPKSELFKLPSDALNPNKFFDDYNNQYITDYEYGAETNMDNLYPENMKILAPLHIGKHIPDFFCIFRYDGTYNTETYMSQNLNNKEKFIKLLKDSKTVKIFDLRTYTSIGNYLNKYKDLINEFLYGSCNLQFIEQDNEKYDKNYRQGNNSWKGIDISKGLITNKIETSYFGANILQSEDDGIQEAYNNYIISGYERNNVIYPYIINLEFMFNDDESENFSMHRYFGLYLSMNEFIKYDCIINDTMHNNEKQYRYDLDGNVINDDSVLKDIFSGEFDDKLFFMTTNNDAVRIQNTDDVHDFITKYVNNNPDVNICDVTADRVVWNEKSYISNLYPSNENKDINSDVVKLEFLSMYFTKPIHYGEHFRFIVMNQITDDGPNQNICLELVASNDSRLLQTDNYISPYISTNKVKNSNIYTQIYRMNFYTQSLVDSTQEATLYEQFQRMNACLYRMNSFIYPESFNDDCISFSTSYADVYFQHIAAMSQYDEPDYQCMFIKDKQITYSGSVKYTELGDSYIKDIYAAVLDKDSTYPRPVLATDSDEGAIQTRTNIQIDDNNDLYVNNLGNFENDIATYVDYLDENNQRTDYIRYFSRENITNMYPLSPDTIYPEHDIYQPFGLFGYEALGWRFNTIVKFKKMSDFNNPYVVYHDMDAIFRSTKYPLVKIQAGSYEPLNDISVKHGFISDNIIKSLNINDLSTVITKKEYMFEDCFSTIIYPYDVNAYLVDFAQNPYIHNKQICLYSPESASICVMGIYSIKDIDIAVNHIYDDTIETSISALIPAGTVIAINSIENSIIQKDVLYRVENGSFNELNLWKFCISGDKIYYTSAGTESSVTVATFNDGVLTASTDVYLTALDNMVVQEYSYKNESAVQDIENFFNKKNGKLFIPIVPLTNCIWESNGNYFDWNSQLNVNELNRIYEYNGYFTEHTQSPVSQTEKNKFMKNSLGSYFRYGDELYSFREVIFNKTVSNPIRKMLIQNMNIDTAVGYYNSYVQTLEFIYYGIKFILKFNSEYYSQTIRMNEFNNFEVYVINDYSPLETNEIIVSTEERIILLLNHKFDITSGKSRYQKVNSISGELTNDVGYSVYPAPYSVYTDSITGMSGAVICQKSNNISIPVEYYYTTEGEQTVEHKVPTYFIQDSNPQKNYVSEMTSPESISFSYEDSSEVKSSISVHDSNKFGILKYYMNIYTVDTYDMSSETYEYMNSNYRKNNPFIVREYESQTNADDMEYVSIHNLSDYIGSWNGDFTCHIIGQNSTQSITSTKTYRPISLQLSKPNRVKYNFGYFMPRFYDIVEFDTNDYKLGKIINMSMLLGNTSIKKINELKSYTGNKVFSHNRNVIRNFFIRDSKSIFESNWDRNYYRHYNNDNDENDFDYLNGYVPGIEDKSFFGSKCFVYRNKFIELDDFSTTTTNNNHTIINSDYNVFSKNKKQYKLTINITQSIYNMLENDSVFKRNWNGLQASQITTSMQNYIHNIILNIFNIQRDVEVKIYKHNIIGNENLSDENNKDVNIEYKKVDVSDWEVMNDFKTEFSMQNEDMMLKITFVIDTKTQVHPVIKIFRI